jgi:hypothetical protein
MEELKQAELQEEKARAELEKSRREVEGAKEKVRGLADKLERCRKKPQPKQPPPQAPKAGGAGSSTQAPGETIRGTTSTRASPPPIPMPPPVYSEPQHLNGRQLKLGMEHESKKLAGESLLEPSCRGCPDACWGASYSCRRMVGDFKS